MSLRFFYFLFGVFFWGNASPLLAQVTVVAHRGVISWVSQGAKPDTLLQMPESGHAWAWVQHTKVSSKFGSYSFKEGRHKKTTESTKWEMVKVNDTLHRLESKTSAGDRMRWWMHVDTFHKKIIGRFSFSGNLHPSGKESVGVSTTFLIGKQELPYGLGEQFSHLHFKGKRVPVFTEEQGAGRGDWPLSLLTGILGIKGDAYSTYCGIPWFITNASRGFFVEGYHRVIFDFRKKESFTITVPDTAFTVECYYGATPSDVMQQFTQKTGRMPPLPEWAYGTWLGIQGGWDKVLLATQAALQAGNPVSALWIQDWCGRRKTRLGSQLFWNWEPDTALYPRFRFRVDSLRKNGIATLGYVNSFLNQTGNLAREALEQQLVVYDTLHQPLVLPTGGFDAYLLNLYKPETQNWLKQVIQTRLMGNGLSGWMADFSEWYPISTRVSRLPLQRQVEEHNRYPVEWARLNREAIQEANAEKDVLFFNRSGFSYSARYSTLFWMGDQTINWKKNDGIKSALVAMLSSGVSGISLNHSDIGGYTTITVPGFRLTRSRELFYRWAEMAAFSPVFRTHEGLKPTKNIQFYTDSATQHFFARMGKLHFALKPYLQLWVNEASQKGLPVIRPLWFHYPYLPEALTCWTQFMLGEDLMMVPVLDKNKQEVEVWFPPGKWEHWLTGKVYENHSGGFITIDAPIGKPAAFIRAGSPNEPLLRTCFANCKR